MAKYFFKIKENKNANEAFKIEVNQNIQIDNNRKVDKVNCDEEYLFDFDKCYGQGLLEANKRKKYIEDKLNAYQFPEKSNDVDLSNVMSDWFPVEKWDIFLSHSHNEDDERMAIAISYYLQEKFQLKCFVDSYTWGYADTLLKKMEDYVKKNGTINEGIRNAVATHVHIMLNSALMKTMQSATAFLFLQTNNSLENKHMTAEDWTYSSWIYSELCMSRVMWEIANPSPSPKSNDKPSILLDSVQLPMGYSDATTSHLKNITLEDLQFCFHPYYRMNDIFRNEDAFERLFKRAKTDEEECIYDVGLGGIPSRYPLL